MKKNILTVIIALISTLIIFSNKSYSSVPNKIVEGVKTDTLVYKNNKVIKENLYTTPLMKHKENRKKYKSFLSSLA